LRPTEPSSLLTRPAALLGQKGFSEQINSSTSHVEGFFSEESKNCSVAGALKKKSQYFCL
jgi:hypothetical protein